METKPQHYIFNLTVQNKWETV